MDVQPLAPAFSIDAYHELAKYLQDQVCGRVTMVRGGCCACPVRLLLYDSHMRAGGR